MRPPDIELVPTYGSDPARAVEALVRLIEGATVPVDVQVDTFDSDVHDLPKAA